MPSWGRRRSAEEREALNQGLTIKTEAQMDAALYEESLEAAYGEPTTETGERWQPQKLLRFAHPGRSSLPTVDDDPTVDPHVFPKVYPAWGPGETFVVSGPLGDYGDDFSGIAGLSTGRPFHRRKDAREWATKKYGHIFEEVLIKGRYCLRVPMPGPAGAKHRPPGFNSEG